MLPTFSIELASGLGYFCSEAFQLTSVFKGKTLFLGRTVCNSRTISPILLISVLLNGRMTNISETFTDYKRTGMPKTRKKISTIGGLTLNYSKLFSSTNIWTTRLTKQNILEIFETFYCRPFVCRLLRAIM